MGDTNPWGAVRARCVECRHFSTSTGLNTCLYQGRLVEAPKVLLHRLCNGVA